MPQTYWCSLKKFHAYSYYIKNVPRVFPDSAYWNLILFHGLSLLDFFTTNLLRSSRKIKFFWKYTISVETQASKNDYQRRKISVEKYYSSNPIMDDSTNQKTIFEVKIQSKADLIGLSRGEK